MSSARRTRSLARAAGVAACVLWTGCSRTRAAPAPDPSVVDAQQYERAVAALPAEPLPPPELEDLFWTTYGQDGKTLLQVRQTAKSRGSCTVTGMRGSDALWSSRTCIAKRGHLRFVSRDGEKLLVVYPEPEVDGPAGDVEVAALFTRGVRARTYTVAQVMGSLRGARLEAGQLHWLGRELPFEVAEGVRLTLADGRGELLSFAETTTPGSAAARAAVLRASPVVLEGARR